MEHCFEGPHSPCTSRGQALALGLFPLTLMTFAGCAKQLLRMVSTLQWRMAWPAKLRVTRPFTTDAAQPYSKNPPSDSTPGSWNSPLAANKTTTVPAGLSITTQDMGSVLQLGANADTIADAGSGQQMMTQPGAATPPAGGLRQFLDKGNLLRRLWYPGPLKVPGPCKCSSERSCNSQFSA